MKIYLKHNTVRSISQTGRGGNGRKIVWTKGSSPSVRRLPVIPTNPFLQSLFTVLSLQTNPRNSNVYSLTAHPTGLLLNQPQSGFSDLFSFLYTSGLSQNLKFFFPKPTSLCCPYPGCATPMRRFGHPWSQTMTPCLGRWTGSLARLAPAISNKLQKSADNGAEKVQVASQGEPMGSKCLS